jgi:hypothetical protein
MMYRLKLPDADRQRYRVPEWITYDPGRPSLGEMRRLKAETGLGWTELQEMLWGRTVDGGERATPSVDDRVAALGILCWLAVCRTADKPFGWDDFEVSDMYGVDVEWVDDPNRSAPDGASATTN